MKLDPQLTKQLQGWLAADIGARDQMEGARLLLKLNRNRAFYNTVIRNPAKYAAKLEYELKKFLRIRLDGMTRDKILAMEAKVVPSARQVLDSSSELPEARNKGRRPDHDQLPDAIKALWDSNLQYYHQINLLFEELKAMNTMQPCDRFDKLQLLAAVDSRYRSNLAKYDAYVPGTDPGTFIDIPPDEVSRRIKAQRKTISKYRGRLTGDDADKLTDERKTHAIDAIQRAVDMVREYGGTFTEDTIEELSKFGISFG